MILNTKNDANKNFDALLKTTKDTLDLAIIPFLRYLAYDEAEFFEFVRYDYESLLVTTVYSLLNLLIDNYGKNLPTRIIIESMFRLNTGNATDDETNRKRLERILNAYNKRSKEHAEYLNYSEYKPRLLVADAELYDILSDVPILKRFLYDKEPIIKKDVFFNELNRAYEIINTKSGYRRFQLIHKLERHSKLEMFYKVLTLIKKEKRRLKLGDADVQKLIEKMYDLHILSCDYIALFNIIAYFGCAEIYYEVVGSLNGRKTVNNIVFNVDNLIDYYKESPSGTATFLQILNFIHDAVSFHLDEKIAGELSFTDNMAGLEFIRSIQLCDKATEFFENYLCTHNTINMKKDYSKDLTFEHFKKIYNIRKERSKK